MKLKLVKVMVGAETIVTFPGGERITSDGFAEIEKSGPIVLIVRVAT